MPQLALGASSLIDDFYPNNYSINYYEYTINDGNWDILYLMFLSPVEGPPGQVGAGPRFSFPGWVGHRLLGARLSSTANVDVYGVPGLQWSPNDLAVSLSAHDVALVHRAKVDRNYLLLIPLHNLRRK
jgi:hypothetical protein